MSEYNKKLIEVTLPLNLINIASEADKNIKTGHIRNIHKWFTPMPLPAWRALLFAALAPYSPEKKERYFSIIGGLVSKDKKTVQRSTSDAKKEIANVWKGSPPVILDPFCGGGSTIVEDQRLGLHSIGSDINPIPVMITSALTSFVQRFSGNRNSSRKSILNDARKEIFDDINTLASEVENRARKKAGHLFPEVIPKDGTKATVTSAIWARTVRTPNPAFNHTHVPPVKSFWVSKSKGNRAWIDVRKEGSKYSFNIKTSGAPSVLGTMVKKRAKCVLSDEPIPFDYIRSEAKQGKLGKRLMAIQCVVNGKKTYVGPDSEYERLVPLGQSTDATPLSERALGFRVQEYGITHFEQLFTQRQVYVLDAFAEAVREVRNKMDAIVGVTYDSEDTRSFKDGGAGVTAYWDGLQLVLSLAVGKLVQSNNTLEHDLFILKRSLRF